jgi:undecaprenyl-diphosphatase
VVYWKRFINFKHISFYLKLLVAVIPALVFGALLKKHIDASLSNLTFIACVMLGGGIILLFIDSLFKTNNINEEEKISYPKALVIGFFQVLSILLPGLSRSAATIIGGMSQKLTRSLAAEFSFFLAVPTMLAASIKSFWDACRENYLVQHGITKEQAEGVHIKFGEILNGENLHTLFNHDNLIAIIIGGIVSFVVALIAVKFLINYLQKHGFKAFGWYRIALGALMLVLIFTKVVA